MHTIVTLKIDRGSTTLSALNILMLTTDSLWLFVWVEGLSGKTYARFHVDGVFVAH